jgi:hypothetical protein
MTKRFAVLFALAVLLCALPLIAAVTFDPVTGEGFVGRGDVLTALGKQAVSNVENGGLVKFAYEDTTDYLIECVHDKTQKVQTFKRKKDLGGKVDADVRNNKKGVVNGFILEGYTRKVTLEPKLNPCEGNSFIFVSLDPIPGTGTGAELTATYGSITATLWKP